MGGLRENTGAASDSPRRRRPLGWFVIDVRSLAALRIALSAMILVDLACRAPDLAAHYTDGGVLPRSSRLAMEHNGEIASGAWAWSLHMATGTAWGQAVFFVVAALFAVWLLIGYRTRLAAAASWLLLVSLYYRNPLLEDAGDAMLRNVLFFSMFLPLGAAASVDRWLRPADHCPPREIASLSGAALLLQICMIYWSTAAEKFSPIWFQDHTALYYALSIDAFASPLGHSLLAYPRLLAALTAAIYWLEWIGPLIAVSPLGRGWPRLCLVLTFWTFHFGIAITMNLGVLPWISMAIWTVFLPGVLWERLGCRLPAADFAAANRWASLRRIFGRPEAPYASPSRFLGILAAALAAYVAVWNINQVTGAFEGRWPPGWKAPAYLLALEQRWAMFAPHPLADDGWYEMRGILADGSEVNLWAPGQPLPTRKPADVAATYRNQRWQKYLMELRVKWSARLPDFADWLRRRWKAGHAAEPPSRRLARIKIIYHIEKTLAPDRTSTLVVPEITFQADCPPDLRRE